MVPLELAKVTSKGQITIPVSIRRRLSINTGDSLLFIDKPEGVLMMNPDLVNQELSAKDIVAALASAGEQESPIISMDDDIDASTADISSESDGDGSDSSSASNNAAARENAGRVVPASAPSPAGNSTYDVAGLLNDIRSIGSKI